MSKTTLIVILFGLFFLAVLVYSTMGLQQWSCEVCMSFNGRTNCATASAPNREEATSTAKTTACATISFGMTESIQCSNATPDSVNCTQN